MVQQNTIASASTIHASGNLIKSQSSAVSRAPVNFNPIPSSNTSNAKTNNKQIIIPIPLFLNKVFCRNIYQLSREALGLTREAAAEKLEFLSPDRIEKIENEKSLPHPEEILTMADAYKNPSLCNCYCSHECPIGQQYVPEIQIKDLSQISQAIDSLKLWVQKAIMDGNLSE